MFNASSKAAIMASELWRVNGWATTGTPLGAGVSDIHGLLVFLDHDPFADDVVLRSEVVRPYEARQVGSFERLSGLLSRFMLHRTKATVQAQISMPGHSEELVQVALSASERGVYDEVFTSARNLLLKARIDILVIDLTF